MERILPPPRAVPGDLIQANDSADQGESEEGSYEKVRELAIVDRSVSLRNPIAAWTHSRRAILIAAFRSAAALMMVMTRRPASRLESVARVLNQHAADANTV